MSLITADYVKENFEIWESLATRKPTELTSDETLEKKIALAEAEFSQYISASDPDELTAELHRHLFNIVKKYLFDIAHGDTVFEDRPQILLDYDNSIEALKLYGRRVAEVESSASIMITSKSRRYGTWFNETDAAETTTTPS